ncbi:MAG: restriction endonuclease subunit S [Bacteroidales bacterium]|nr:restriction endonuclease subunit S [Bacteroidales bacterium]
MKHNWENKRLGEVCKLSAGGDKPVETTKEKTLTNVIPVYSNGIEKDGLYGYCSKAKVFNDALTISGRGTIGYPSIKREPFVPIIRLIVAEPKDNIKVDYLYYWVHNRRFSGNGVTIPQLTVPMIKNEIIPVPPMDVQEQIVAELDKINEIISDCKEAIRNLDALAQSLFYDYFGDPITNPKGWDTVTLGFVSSKISNGANAKIEHDTYKSSGIMFFRCQNVWKNRIDYSDIVYVDEKFNQQFKSSSLKHNDLLVTKIGRLYTENSSLGRVSIYEGEDDKANLSGNLSFIRLTNEVNPQFILYMLISDYFRDYVRNTTTGGIDKRALNNSQLKAFPIFLPPLELQKKFAARIEQIKQQKKCLEETIANMQTLLNSRMDYWFN